jgi:hypothetical protein
VHRQPRIADASQLEFRMVHRNDMTGRMRLWFEDGVGTRRPDNDSLNGALVSRARSGRSTA